MSSRNFKELEGIRSLLNMWVVFIHLALAIEFRCMVVDNSSISRILIETMGGGIVYILLKQNK